MRSFLVTVLALGMIFCLTGVSLGQATVPTSAPAAQPQASEPAATPSVSSTGEEPEAAQGTSAPAEPDAGETAAQPALSSTGEEPSAIEEESTAPEETAGQPAAQMNEEPEAGPQQVAPQEQPQGNQEQAPVVPAEQPEIAPGVAEPGPAERFAQPPPPVPAAQGAQPSPSMTPGAAAPGGHNMITLAFSGPVELPALLDYVRQRTGKNFIYDATSFQGRVTILPTQQIPEDKLFTLLESILAYQNFVMVPTTGNWIEIHRIQDVPKRPSPLVTPEDLAAMGETDAVVTVVYRMKYLSAMDVQNQISPMATGQGTIIVLARSNVILMTDYGSNLKRLLTLLTVIDSERSIPQLRIFVLKYTSAADVSQQILRVVRNREAGIGAMQPGQSANVDYDTGTNKLLVTAMGDEMSIIQQLIDELDIPSKIEGRNIRIYALRNATVKEIAPTLEQLTNQIPAGVRQVPGSRPAAPGQPGPGPQPGAMTAMGTIGQVQVKIIGDETTNSIIVLGPPEVQSDIKALIEELDKRKAQVLIEALIVQVSGNRDASYGAELQAFGRGATHGEGFTGFGMSTGDPTTAGGRKLNLGDGGVGKGLAGALVIDNQIPVIIQALLTDGKGQVISRPRLLVGDNTEANFKSVDQQPTTQLNSVTSTTSVTSFQQYIDAGTDLTIKPHISPTAPGEGQTDYLTLEITLDLSAFKAAASANASVPPPRREDKIKSTVQVPDNSTLVVGGLSGHHYTSTVDKVPLLGSIPVIGALFSRTNTTRDDSTEYIFIKARIARALDFQDLVGLSRGPERETQKLQNKWAKGVTGDVPEEAIQGIEPSAEPK